MQSDGVIAEPLDKLESANGSDSPDSASYV